MSSISGQVIPNTDCLALGVGLEMLDQPTPWCGTAAAHCSFLQWGNVKDKFHILLNATIIGTLSFFPFLFPLMMNIFPLCPHSASSLNISVRRRNQILVAALANSESDYELLNCSGLFPAARQNTTQATVVSRSQAPVPH